MKEVFGDIWEYYKDGYFIVVPTNGTIKSNGQAVMGRGLAKQLAEQQPEFPSKLGKALAERGNRLFYWNDKIITFPVKHEWHEKANLELIEKSCKELKEIVENTTAKIAMPRVGCGNGKLSWSDVRPIIDYYLGNNVIIVDNTEPVRERQ